VCVQGLGFVGIAMATAVANARDAAGNFLFDVVGVDLANEPGREKVEAINSGRLPVSSVDQELVAAFATACREGTLVATTDPRSYGLADITVVDIHLDVAREDGHPTVNLDGFRAAISTLGEHMRPGSLIVVETTVPPGTCQRVAAPVLAEALRRRGLAEDAILLAHSYERVMPGKEYYRSIVRYWRVFAGSTEEAADACQQFLSKLIDVEHYPLRRLHSITASETAKVLENSYRATNIAFIEEWARFAERVGIDLFEVVDAIRLRPTHANIRQPGFGVGGYCLTKDPLLAAVAARELFGLLDCDFPFSTRAVEVNDRMPLVTLDKVRAGLGGILHSKTIMLLGVSYREDVGDTRHSPSEIFLRAAEAEGARVICHDPLVQDWRETGRRLPAALPAPGEADAVVFAVPHGEYVALDVAAWLDGQRPLVVDANAVLSASQRAALRQAGITLVSVGRGV
jgi:UDP-N-acetyl-D-glucosamine dehydrogenase